VNEANAKNSYLLKNSVKRRQRTHAASGGASKALPHEIWNQVMLNQTQAEYACPLSQPQRAAGYYG
jgi:hypothetical protein